MTSLYEIVAIGCAAWTAWLCTHNAATTAMAGGAALFALVTVGSYITQATKCIVNDALGPEEVKRRWELRLRDIDQKSQL